MAFQIICLTETWLNAMCFDHKLFPDSFTTFRSDSGSSTNPRGGVVIAVSSRIGTFKRSYAFQFYEECVRFEIFTQNARSLLTDNHYFSPDTKPDALSKYFCSLEKNVDTKNHRFS
jgi:hypothetical protein